MSGNMPAGTSENDIYFNDDPDGLDEEELGACEFHDVALNPDGECPVCLEDMRKQQAYYGALYARGHHYSREEILDSLSDPSERNKRDILLERLSQ